MLRHTGCTRNAENGMDMKVLQYLMGHFISLTSTLQFCKTDIRKCKLIRWLYFSSFCIIISEAVERRKLV